MHSASAHSDCPGAFEAAFVSGTLGGVYNHTELRGYRHESGAIKPITATDDEDIYELLAKGIGAYNGGAGFIEVGAGKKHSWPELLATTKDTKKAKNNNGLCFSCGYTIKIRNENYGLPYRTYIWKGEGYDVDLKLSDGITPDPNAGKEWCFAYGEKEWVDGKSWSTALQAAGDKDKYGNIQTPLGRVNCN